MINSNIYNITNHHLFHYTSYKTFKAIFDPVSDDNRYILMHATDYRYLNDPTESQYLLNCVYRMIEVYERNNTIPKGDLILPHLRGHMLFRVLQSYHKYILSFSTDIDNLPMWRCYANNGSGIAIGICKDHFDNRKNNDSYSYNIETLLCNYDAMKNIDNIFDYEDFRKKCFYRNDKGTLSIKRKEFDNYFGYLFSYKHPGYRYENEIRSAVTADPKDIRYKYRGRQQLPYAEIKFPVDNSNFIVVVGPTANRERRLEIIDKYLMKKNINAVVTASDIPYVAKRKNEFKNIRTSSTDEFLNAIRL